MNRTSLTFLLVLSMAVGVGCSSKNYVKQQTTPLINKTNELDDLTAKNSRDIKDVDARAQAAIQQVNSKTAEVEQKTQTAAQQASQAQTQADNAVHRVDVRSEEHTSELQSLAYLVCRLLLEKKKKER